MVIARRICNLSCVEGVHCHRSLPRIEKAIGMEEFDEPLRVLLERLLAENDRPVLWLEITEAVHAEETFKRRFLTRVTEQDLPLLDERLAQELPLMGVHFNDPAQAVPVMSITIKDEPM
jgi:hypothetical protein